MHKFLKDNGFGLIEILISGALLGALILAAMALSSDRHKAANAIEYAGKKEQIRLALVEQILVDRFSCSCMFGPTVFNKETGIARIDAIAPYKLGRYHIPPASSCDNATIPNVISSSEGVDSVKIESISIQDVKLINNRHFGNFVVLLSSTKDVAGAKKKGIRVPVYVETEDAGGGNVKLNGCSVNPYSIPLIVPEEHFCANGWCAIPGSYRFCGLSQIYFGGHEGGGSDYCRVETGGNSDWGINGNKAAPPANCKAICFK